MRQRSTTLSPPQTTAPAIPADEAIDVALDAVPGGIVELDLDTDRGRVVWEALIAADAGGLWEVYVDAATADVLKQEQDD
ncbi:PepSY domain-containing protein [Microbacterium sp. NIBRBAC000506063]|uniref:PepSY domain-containing protein n=1 Tax=Microbacterium sp. NIBRBAC000506063 TaxID=2734618 RepID=UPI001BB7B97B|nr:PepSY domain-containing protein [Microbacterium sp. NIBRBAC000506063]QTV80077.1 PepSY domain-containing protein [Microbacterium sp. NIBRBAC000506063]